MRKIISAILACVLILGCMLTLASCGGIDNGEYKGENGEIVRVSGKKMFVQVEGLEDLEFVYKFKVKDDKITLTLKKINYDGDDKKVEEQIKVLTDGINAKDPVKSFEAFDGGFKIDGVEYKAK